MRGAGFRAGGGDGEGESVPARLNAVMPEGIVVQKCYDAQTPVKALTYVNYILSLEYENGAPFGAETAIRELLGREGLVVVKKSGRQSPARWRWTSSR